MPIPLVLGQYLASLLLLPSVAIFFRAQFPAACRDLGKSCSCSELWHTKKKIGAPPPTSTELGLVNSWLCLSVKAASMVNILARGISVLHLAEDLFKGESSSLSASVDSGGGINPKHLSVRRTYPFDSGIEPKLISLTSSPAQQTGLKISGRDRKGGSV
ncbi:hypothetical protein B0H13DRAFT_1879038 [Mycena leptocephala]|nr:hypothetical protein B0H13DRAFT_1879038 [Mycena leptocephala]